MIELFTEEYFWSYYMYLMYKDKSTRIRYVGKW